LFGAGIVETEEDFGAQGAVPSHPELLDWLASEFMRLDWDMKATLKTIVMSATYRQSSNVTPVLLEKDPRNRLLARGARFRLDAEVVRDQALAVSGLLSAKLYGPPVMPWQPDGIWAVVYNAERWTVSDGEDRYRRGLYTFMRRTSPYPSMITYDAPTGEVCTIRRIRTNTPLQALATLNDPVSMEAAQRLATRTLKESSASDIERAEHMFRLVLSRPPSKAERKRIQLLHTQAAAEIAAKADSQFKLLNYDKTIYPSDREVVLVNDARTKASTWRYTTTDPGAGWEKSSFDDSKWNTGVAQFGQFAKPPAEAKIATPWDTEHLWARIEFDAPSTPLQDFRIEAYIRGGFDAFVNGVSTASTNLDRISFYEYKVTPEAATTIKPGRNVLAIHVVRLHTKATGQLFDASLRAIEALPTPNASKDQAKRAAWVVVANTLLNLDETLTRR
jgi:hypothetical protein